MKNTIRILAIASLGFGSAAIADDAKPQGERAMQQVYFAFDSATPQGDLLAVANLLQCTPKETIILDGYADPMGTNAYNADLSKRRAEAVRDKFIEYGISKDRILIGAFGEEQALSKVTAPNRLDRRVDIRTSAESIAILIDRRRATAVAIETPTGKLEARATIPATEDK